MKRLLLSGVLCFILISLCKSEGNSAKASQTTYDSTYINFINPGNEYKGVPFWAWNGRLEKDELLWQIDVFKKMGMGGFFMHSRTGLNTEYLGKEWMNLINASADKAQKEGMIAWLYDEDRWPSGTAGGIVTQDPQYRAKFICFYSMPGDQFTWNDSIVAAFACNLNGVSYTDCSRILPTTPASFFTGKTVLKFVVEEMKKSDFYNGYTYLNTLKREATEKFIELTHEKYKEYCGSRLGTSIAGIFTDEPYRGSLINSFKNGTWMAPWTEELPAAFKKRFGYDPVDHLPELFLKKDSSSIAEFKWHYVEILQEMFLDNFMKPLYQWCEENNMQFTGHLLHEDNLTAQTAAQGSLMRSYEYMHCPGVDVLTEGNRNYCIVKQLASAARQLGKTRLLSELYGCSGWQMTFENYKATGNWQALFGINLRCHHMSWYTMEGEAKRDYPASIFFQSGWWQDFNKLEDYFSRLNFILSQGKPSCDLLVINPVESVWCQVGIGWANGLAAEAPEIIKLEEQYSQLYNWLLGARIDYDYGDEEMISRLYRIDKDTEGTPVLWIGKAPYKTVLVSGMLTIRSSTMNIIEEFKKQGGNVIFAGEPPRYVDVVKSSRPETFSAQTICVPFEKDVIISICKKFISPVVEATDSETGKPIDDIFCQVRIDRGIRYIVLMNMSTTQTYKNVKVTIPGTGTVTEWNCMSSEKMLVRQKQSNKVVEITTDFYPSGEHLFVLEQEAEEMITASEEPLEQYQVLLPGPYNYQLSEKNICVLDIASYKINKQKSVGPTEILKIDQAVRTSFGLKHRSGSMIQPWYSAKYGNNTTVRGVVIMNFEFQVADIPRDTVYLGIERPEYFNIKLNGYPIVSESKGWWVDPSIKKVVIPEKAIILGKNSLELTVNFSEDKNLEALYLIGNFGVQLNGTTKILTHLPGQIKTGDLAIQGFPFYTGCVTYKIPISGKFAPHDQLIFTAPKFEAAYIKIHSPDHAPRMIAWQPYTVNVTADLQKNNYLLVDVVLTRRNSFGPLHALPLRAGAYGPENFTTSGGSFSKDYQLIPSGLLSEPFISVRQ